MNSKNRSSATANLKNCGQGYYIRQPHFGIATGVVMDRNITFARLYLIFQPLPCLLPFKTLSFCELVSEEVFWPTDEGRPTTPRLRDLGGIFADKISALKTDIDRLRDPPEAIDTIQRRELSTGPFWQHHAGIAAAYALLGEQEKCHMNLQEAIQLACEAGVRKDMAMLQWCYEASRHAQTSSDLVAFARKTASINASRLQFPAPQFD
jgi:hypothetical protein